jgi:hypothetical protein
MRPWRLHRVRHELLRARRVGEIDGERNDARDAFERL